jgi:pyruvate,water dikinase
MENKFTIRFKDIRLKDIAKVGGKNASIGEMYSQLSAVGIRIPDGFAITANAYNAFLNENNCRDKLLAVFKELDVQGFSNLKKIGESAREIIRQSILSNEFVEAVLLAYTTLDSAQQNLSVAVRSSATAEDLPEASFAGQHESFLNVKGDEALIIAVKKCYVSMFTDRAIKYREDNGFHQLDIALSVGVQKMVRADLASSGVVFTIEPESGFKDIVHVSGTWGLGENIVQGTVTPDEFFVFKPLLNAVKNPIVSKKLGSKLRTMVYADNNGDSTLNLDTPVNKQRQFVLSDMEIINLSNWAFTIEKHYNKPMDIEWAKDGLNGDLYIVQARPETVHSRKNPYVFKEYLFSGKHTVLASGTAVGNRVSAGSARILKSPAESDKLLPGEILVTEVTSPDWDPILKKAGGIITVKGGRTSHASIVAREIGLAAIVGAEDALLNIIDGQQITISCAEGKTGFVYDGIQTWTEKEIDSSKIPMPATAPMLILGDPDKAFKYSFYPNKGIGLMRLEFIISNSVKIHPMALVKFNELKDEKVIKEIEALTYHYTDVKKYFSEKMAQAVATIACAFYPKEVIVRMSDFKTNEYANLIGGKEFEPIEENPMLGFRGASRYYNEKYKEGFKLECDAIKMVRNEMGLTNVKLMIPFCRTVAEGKKVIEVMKEFGLEKGVNGLEIYVMAEIPSNVLLAEQFAEVFDGFSIGSNDLTQLTLGIDRDSSIISDLFDEQDLASKIMIETVIKKAKACARKIGLCGQAPSDHKDFAYFLVEKGIDSISFNPDALISGVENINLAEEKLKQKRALQFQS